MLGAALHRNKREAEQVVGLPARPRWRAGGGLAHRRLDIYFPPVRADAIPLRALAEAGHATPASLRAQIPTRARHAARLAARGVGVSLAPFHACTLKHGSPQCPR